MPSSTLSRRSMLRATLALSLGGTGFPRPCQAASNNRPPTTRVITRGPKHHWFGYYDKLEFDPQGRYVLGMEVDFEHRSPRPADVIKIGLVDLEDGDRWIELGQSSAWCWQQGCMLQWLPGSTPKILWNDRLEDRYVCRILDVRSRRQRTVEHPVYALSPDGKTAIAADFRRIQDVRPGYGYVGLADPHGDDPAPRDSGVFHVDLESGRQELIVSLADIARFGTIPRPEEGVKHYVNHLLFNPDGSRFVFLHRWRYADGSRLTRMFTAAPDGSQVHLVDDNGLTSHFIWRDPQHILAFSNQPSHGKRFYLFEDGGARTIEVVGQDVLRNDGHCSYLPGQQWIVNDTYPGKRCRQSVYLVHVPSGRKVVLGSFPSPPRYRGEWRCDTHPRVSPDGCKLVIDSPHDDQGRQLHLIDISGIV